MTKTLSPLRYPGGVLGGLSQNGIYKLNCRFNKEEIKKKIERIVLLKKRISLYNCDASDLITRYLKNRKSTFFLLILPMLLREVSFIQITLKSLIIEILSR